MMKKLFLCLSLVCSPLLMYGQSLTPQSDDAGKWGFVDDRGNTVIPFEYDEVSPFVDGSAAVEKQGHCGLIDASGCALGRGLVYGGIDLIGNHCVYRVELRGKLGLIDFQGREVLPADCDAIELGDDYVSYGHFLHSPSATVGMIDYTGRTLLPEGIMKQTYPLSDGMVVGKGESKTDKTQVWKLYDTAKGTTLELPSPQGIVYNPFRCGYALVTESQNVTKLLNRYAASASITLGMKASTSAEKQQQMGKATAGSTAANVEFYQNRYNKYGRQVKKALKAESADREYIASIQANMKRIAKEAADKGFTIERNEWETK